MMRLSSTTSVALLLALASCLSMPFVEAKTAAADIDTTSPSIRRRAVESDKKDKTNDKKKEEEKPKCISVVGQPCHPSVADMACCLDSSQAQFLQCDDKNFLCKQMKDKDIEKLLAAEAAANAGGGAAAYGVAQAPNDKKNSKQKEPSCVEAIGGWCDDISSRCCLNPSKSQFLQCKNNACAHMKDKDVEKMLEGAASTSAGGGCRSDKDCCDEDKECNEVTGECFKPSCPKQCFHNDDCKPCNKDCIEGKCSSSCPTFCSKDSECRDCNKICLNNKCEKPQCDWCNDDKDCRACGEICQNHKCEKPSCDLCNDDKDCRSCGEICNMSKFECEKPKCPDVCVDDDQCKPCGEECMNGRCVKDCVA